MNCEDCRAILHTGTAWHLLRARWHVRRCPQCAADERRLDQLLQSLAEPVTLTPHDRERWLQVAQHNPSEPAPRISYRSPTWVAWGALAACLMAMIVGAYFWHRGGPEPSQRIEIAEDRASSVTGSDELARLALGVDRLEEELQQVSQEAELIEIRRQVGALLATYRPW